MTDDVEVDVERQASDDEHGDETEHESADDE